jgi:hypothetical protein
MKKKLFFLVVLLVTMVAGAWGADPDLKNDYTLVKSVTWGDGTAIDGSEACSYTAYETGNARQQSLTVLSSPKAAAGWIAMQGWTADASGKGWWNRESKSLYCVNGSRSAAVFGDDLRTGWLVVFDCTQDASAVMTLTNAEGNPDGTFTYAQSEDTKSYYCTINADYGAYVGFCGVKNTMGISKISVYKPAGEEPEEPVIPDLAEYDLVKSVTWGGETDLTRADAALTQKTYNSENNVMSPVYPLTAPTDAAGWIAVQGTNSQDTKGWWNRASNGLWSYNATRSAAVYGDDLDYGWLVVFECTQDATAVMTLENASGDPDGTFTYVRGRDGKTFYCTINAEKNAYVGFCGKKSVGYISKISVYKPKASTFTITVADGIENGTVTVDKTEAAEGEEVTVTATPAKGYELDAITVTGKTSNQAVTVTDGKFTMIADAVTVSATFKAHVHEFVLDPAQSSEPSCTEPGKTVSVCICGEKEEVEIPALGHNFVDGVCTRCKISEGGTTEKGWLLTTPDKLATGDIVVIVDQTSSKAMSNDKGTTAAPAAESVTLSADKSSITDNTVPANIQWVVTVSEEGAYQFNVKGTENYLYVTATNNGVRVGAGDRNAYSIVTGGDNGGYYLYNLFIKEDQSEDKRYVGCYNEADWRCYTSINANIKGNNNAFYKKYGEDAVAAPVIEGETPFIGSTTVTITCETEGAAIYYTTDGTDPTNESTAYVEPFELTASATVKAIAYDVTGANSDVASKEFVATPTVANIAALNALENGTTFAYTGEALVVAKAANENKTYVYIKDETGSSLIYDADASKTEAAVVGKTIAANWTGKVSIFKNLFEAVPDAALSVKDGEAVEVTYPEAQLTDVKAENVSQVVELKGVTYMLDGKSITIYKGQAEAVGYNQFGLEIAAPVEGKTYSIVGAIGRYNDNIQFWPISIEEEKPAPLYVIGDISTGGWVRTAMTQMEYNLQTQAYEYSFTIDNEFAAFAFATYQMTEEEAQADQDWSTFNAEYRWAVGDYDIDASDYVNGDAVQLVKGTTNGTVKLPKGTYTVSVDPETMMMTITGTIAPGETFEYDAVYVAGNGTEGSAWMNGVTWNPLAEDNKMTKVDGTDDVWEITFKDVPASSGDEGYQLKFIPSGQWSADESTTWSVNFGGDFIGYGIETPAAFNSSNNIVFTTTAEQQDITLRIDLSNCDPTTYEGAMFTVIAPAEHNTHVVAGCVGEKEGGADDELFGKAWDGTAEANQLAYDATSKLYTKTYEAVTFEAQTQVKFKIVINGKLWVPAEDQICEIPAAGTYDITVTYNAETGEATMTATLSPEDIVINPDDITGGDITAAIAAKSEGKTVKNLTINLAEGNAYNVTSSIEAPASLTINGNGATVDASALEAAMITTPAGDLTKWQEGDLTLKDLTIKGVKKGVFASGRKNFLFNDFLVENSVIEITGTGGFEFDFRKGGVAKNFTINKSTIYAPTATANSLYTSQSAQRATEAPGVTVQTFAITNSTLYNLAKTKNFFTHRQSNQTWLAFTIENSIFVNCGKSGQVVKGINQGSSGANPTWTISGNVFNFDGKDTSADETTGDEQEPVKDSHAGVMAFTDAANGDFNGTFTAEPVKEEPAVEAASRRAGEVAATLSCGDPRWTIEQKQGQAITIADNIKHGSIKADKIYAAEGEAVKITATPDENFALDKIIVQGVNTDLEVEVTIDPQNPNVGTFIMPADAVIVRAMFKYVIPAGTHILNINDIYAAAKAKTAPCENATANSETKYLLNDATIEMDIFTVVSKSDRTYRIDASTDVDYGDYDSWSRLEPNGTSNKTGGRQMFIDVPEDGGVLYIGAHGAAGRALYVTKAADKTSFVDLSKVAEADVMLKHAFVAGETSPADYNVYKVQLAAGLYCITQDNGIYFTYVKFVEGETYTAPTVSVDALKAEIAAATTLLGKADITVDPGKALNTAIQTATAALKSVNAETTQDAVDQAVTDLQAAEAAYKLAVAKGKLTDEIATATELLGEASTEADTPGAALKKAIDDAQAVLDSTESTLEEVNKATEDLKTAEEAYKTATSINGINASKFADGAWYTTGGVRIDKPTKKGLYIHNGRTVVVK